MSANVNTWSVVASSPKGKLIVGIAPTEFQAKVWADNLKHLTKDLNVEVMPTIRAVTLKMERL